MAANSATTASPLVRETVNRLIGGSLAGLSAGAALPGEAALVRSLGVSRTTLRSALAILAEKGVVAPGPGPGRRRRLVRRVRPGDGYPGQGRAVSRRERVEGDLLEQLLSGRFRPGEAVAELELARRAACTTAVVRESLIHLSRFGLVRKEPRRRWRVVTLDPARIDELTEVRLLMEGRGLERLLADGLSGADRRKWETHRDRHHRLDPRSLRGLQRFIQLDQALHGDLLAASGNRYIVEFSAPIRLLIAFQIRQLALDADTLAKGLGQHRALIDAILTGRRREANRLLREHLQAAGETLKRDWL
ncbi:MAG: GntR family transcriptional regulator [Opitutales bacterium]